MVRQLYILMNKTCISATAFLNSYFAVSKLIVERSLFDQFRKFLHVIYALTIETCACNVQGRLKGTWKVNFEYKYLVIPNEIIC